MGPVPAIRKLYQKTGLGTKDMDVIELNEAFASQFLAVQRELDLPPERTNPNGSGISLGHPIGATGAILAVKSLYKLKRTDGRYALATMCIGGGQGIAAILRAALAAARFATGPSSPVGGHFAGGPAARGVGGPGHAQLQQQLRRPRRRQAAADLRPDRRGLQRLGLQAGEDPLAGGAEQYSLQGLAGAQPALLVLATCHNDGRDRGGRTAGRRESPAPAQVEVALRQAPGRTADRG